MKVDVAKGQGQTALNNVEELNPTSTYTLRLIAIKDGIEGEPSDVLTVDTQGPLFFFFFVIPYNFVTICCFYTIQRHEFS